ncbi:MULTISPECIES: S24 family peptidase [unclassified Clostridium]|uniref:LexA family protein n=1 Tax=unclassified Clostridium TaxID=2614128 RepID=UPI0002984641|nr:MULTISPECIES: S24 family peptidase [unclassified Clostridium]EKQ55420.1 MAG: SOS response transcriptional repressor, RecA-mediated autopeptidase [Clostridium sp. Maddingley MBC34-26]
MFNKEKFSELLKASIGANRSITDFSKECGVARPYISKFLNCKLEKAPSPEIIRKFSSVAYNNIKEADLLLAAGYEISDMDYFNLTFEAVIEDDPLNNSVSNTRNKIKELHMKNNINYSNPIKVPVLSFIDNGNIISNDSENVISYDYIPSTLAYDASKCFYYIAEDNSMSNARIHDGDAVFIIPNITYKHNDIVLLLKDGEAFLRRYKKLSNVHLFQAESNDFDSFALTNNDLKNSKITILGTVEHIKIRTKI